MNAISVVHDWKYSHRVTCLQTGVEYNLIGSVGRTIGGVFNEFVFACPINRVHPYHKDTSPVYDSFVSQTWKSHLLIRKSKYDSIQTYLRGDNYVYSTS
jgi:hypothetical protein